MAETAGPTRFRFVNNLYRKWLAPPPVTVPPKIVSDLSDPTKRDQILRSIRATGTTFDKGELQKIMSVLLSINYYRRQMYRDVEQVSVHPYAAGALGLYCDHAVGYSSTNNTSCWITSDDKDIENTLNQFLNDVAINEKLLDWAGQDGQYGDFFVEAIGGQGMGIAYLDDNIHPMDMERVDVNGRLEGFVRTGILGGQLTSGLETKLEPPWRFIHFKIPGIDRKMSNTTLNTFGEPGSRYQLSSAFANVTGQTPFRITTKYGVSLFAQAVEPYKRLKLAEDSVLMSRLTRGKLWNLYRVMVKGGNFAAAAEIVQEYAELIKRSTALNTTGGGEAWKDRFMPMLAEVEDLVLPESDDISVQVDQMGQDANIKAIVDVDKLEDRFLAALRVSRLMLGLTEESGGVLGQSSANRLSINFAKNVWRLQNSLKVGIKRMCQIHLSYIGKSADPSRFEVHMASISTAEEEEIKDALDKGVDVADKLAKFILEYAGDGIDSVSLLDYINQKILKLTDLDFQKLKLKMVESKHGGNLSILESGGYIDSDLRSYLPNNTLYRMNISERKVMEEKVIWVPRSVNFMLD